MEHTEPALLWLAGICAAIISIWGAASRVLKPYHDLNDRVEALEDKVIKNAKKLDADNESLMAQERFNALALKSLASSSSTEQREITTRRCRRRRKKSVIFCTARVEN